MKKIVLFILFGSIFIGCKKIPETESLQSRITAIVISDAETKVDYRGTVDDYVIFTGDDIAWFNPKTREIKFTNIVPGALSIPAYTQIDICMDGEKLFTIVAHINGSINRSYDDLVLFYDLGSEKYYLHDCWPSYWDPESTQRNIEARAKGWSKFLSQLKEEKKLR